MSVNGLRPYPAYRESGVEWLSKVPEHWELRRGKTVFRCIDERSETGSEELLTLSSGRGIVPRDSTSVTMFKARSYVGHKLCWPGDLVINSLWAWNRGLGVSRYHGIVSTAYGVYRVRRKARVLPDFIHSLVRSEAFNWELRVRSKGIWISRLQLTDDSFLRAPLPLPPLSEQGAIVRFLEAADRRIRRYIQAKERLIELLEERKRALIHDAVTGRTDVQTGQPYPAYKDSGINWLGRVPKHWEVRRLKTMVSNTVDPTRSRESGQFCLALENVESWTGRIRLPDDAAGFASQLKSFQAGDILFGKLRPYLAKVTRPERDGACVGEFLVLRPLPSNVIPSYTELVLRSRTVIEEVSGSTFGAKMPRADWMFLGGMHIPRPPVAEQRAIARFLDDADRRIRCHISATKRQIALLKEYRTRLIADVVTGKLDVREAAADLSETDPLARNRNRAETIRTESNLHSTAQDMMKEASA